MGERWGYQFRTFVDFHDFKNFILNRMLQWFNNPLKGTHSSIDDHMETDFSVFESNFKISAQPF